MTNFKMMITADGKHPPQKWADIAADQIIEISAEAPEMKVREATEFRNKVHENLTKHVKAMMDHEQEWIAKGKHGLDLPYETEDYAQNVVNEICGLAKGMSFEKELNTSENRARLEGVCNRIFKSAKLVERHHFHTEKGKAAPAGGKNKK